MRIAAVIPAYNEARTVADVVRRALCYLDWIIVVDDGSQDGTSKQLENLPITLLRHAQNQGKAASLWDGMCYALAQGAQAVITLDADGQHRPENIPQLVMAARHHPGTLIIAARVKNRSQAPRLRRFANGIADFWISWAAGWPISDTQSGFRLYPAALLRHLQVPHGRGHGFVFESEVLIEALRQGYTPVSVAVDAIYPAKSRPSHYRPWLDTARIVRMVAWKLLSRGLYLQGLVKSLIHWQP